MKKENVILPVIILVLFSSISLAADIRFSDEAFSGQVLRCCNASTCFMFDEENDTLTFIPTTCFLVGESEVRDYETGIKTNMVFGIVVVLLLGIIGYIFLRSKR